MLQSFSLRRVNSLRRDAARASTFPEDGPYGWRKSPVDPATLLCAFSPLRLKPGFVLRAYWLNAGGNANGFVYAMPDDAPFREPEQCDQHGDHFLEPPVPPAALPDIMQAIDGDGSPWSYLCASVFARELTEFGARWHGSDWSTHKILDSNPLCRDAGPARFVHQRDREAWKWLEPAPAMWQPTLARDRNAVVVTFYTHSALENERILRHVDRFKSGTYCFRTKQTTVADGGIGFIF